MRRMTLSLITLALLSLSGSACLQPPPTGANAVRGGILGAFPNDSVGLLVLEIKSLKDRRPVARWMSDLASRTDTDGALRAILQQFGGEILTRLDRLALAVVPLAGERTGFGVLAEGDLDETKLVQGLGGERMVTLLEFDGHPDLSVTVLDGGTVAVGPRAILGTIRDNATRSAAGLAGNRPLMALLDRVDATTQIWGVIDYLPMAKLAGQAIGGGDLDKLTLPGPAASGALESIAFQGRFGEPLEFDLIGKTALEDDARRVADAARGLVAIGRMAAGQKETASWVSLLDAIRIEQSGAFVTLHGSVSEADLTMLADGIKEAPTQAPPIVIPAPPAAGPPATSAGSDEPVTSPPAVEGNDGDEGDE